MKDKGYLISTVRDALSFLDRASNLEELRTSHGGLTAKQSGESVEAIRNYNAAAVAINAADPIGNGSEIASTIGERSWGETEMARESIKLRRLLSLLESAKVTEELRAKDPAVFAVADPKSGLTGPGRTDPIRELIESHETRATFDLVAGFAATETRAIADFSDSSSLYVSDFSSQVAVFMRTASPWLDLSTIVNADNGRPLVVPEITADPTSYSPGEGTAITESTPTLSAATATTTAYKALSYLSEESLEDAEFDVTKYIAQTQGRSLALKFGSDATGTVVSGINNAGTASGVGGNGTATITFVGYEDLIDLKYSRAAPYRLGGAWVFSNSLIKKARKFKDGLGGYLWPDDDMAEGQPSSFDSNAVYEDPYGAAVGSASKSALYGDWGRALVVKMMPLRVAVSHEFRFNQDQVAIKTVLRAGIAVQDPAAAAYLVSANS